MNASKEHAHSLIQGIGGAEGEREREGTQTRLKLYLLNTMVIQNMTYIWVDQVIAVTSLSFVDGGKVEE